MKHLEGMRDGAEAASKKPKKAKKVKPMHKKSHNYKRTILDHHSNGSMTIQHEHDSDPSMNQSAGVPDMGGALENLQQHLGGGEAPQSLAAAAPAAPAMAGPAA
jgi:hypothetical protein